MSLDELLQLTDDAKVTLSIRVLKSFAKHVITETCQQMRTDTALGVAEKMVTINEACITLRTTRHTLDRWHSIGYLEPVQDFVYLHHESHFTRQSFAVSK